MTAKDIISFFTEKKFTVEGNTDKFVVKTENIANSTYLVH